MIRSAPLGDDEGRKRRFRVLMEEHAGAVLAYALRRTSSRCEAEDVRQKTFEVAWRRLEDVPPGVAALPWLYAVARFVLANEQRGRRRRERLVLRLVATTPSQAEPDTETREEVRSVLAAMSRLNPQHQEILLLSAWEGLSHTEIATVLGITERASALRLHRARARLGQVMAKEARQGGHRRGRAGTQRPERAPVTRDPFRLLELANPVSAEEVVEPMTSPAMRDLFERIVDAPPSPLPAPPSHLPRPRLQRRLAVIGLVAVTASVGWGVYQATRTPTEPSTVACYAEADLGSRTELVVNDGRPPLEICANLWRQGAFGSVPVPPLVACVIPSGAIAVVPAAAPGTCRTIGASILESEPTGVPPSAGPSLADGTSTTADPVTLVDALRMAIGPQDCVGESQARELVAQELGARGFTAWKVEAQAEFTPERPCTSVGVDNSEQTVRLIPVPPRR